MAIFVLVYVMFALFVDSLLMGFFVNNSYYLLSPIAPLLAFRTLRNSGDNDLKKTKGLQLNNGLDIENPDSPKKKTVILEEKALDLGVLFIGSPGSGKSIAAIVLLQYYTQQRDIGWIYWEGKGDKDIYQKLIACGASPDKFFSCELESTDTTNVVSGSTESILEALTQTLITSESDYYRNAQREALAAVVPLLKAIGKPIILRDIYVMLKVEEAAYYAINLAKEANVKPDIIEVARLFFERDPKERERDINGLMNKMSFFVTGKIAERLNAYNPTLDLVKASMEGQRVYMHLPYSSMAKDIATMFTEQIGVIAKNRQLYDDTRTPWPQVYDDWGKFFYENVGSITARCRSAKMPISYLFQSRGQTDSVDSGRAFTTEIMDNIGGFCAFRINGSDSAKWAAEQFGTYETSELAVSSSSTINGQSLSTQESPRIQADKLKNLNAGEAFISCLISGKNGHSSNKRYQARFPFPDFKNEDAITWPSISADKNLNDNEVEGLNLWKNFMDKDKLKQLKKEVIEQALNQEISETRNDIEEPEEITYL